MMKVLLKLFGIVVWLYLVLNGISFLMRQKGFDLIAYLFYPPEYMDIRVWDLTSTPYDASVFVTVLYLLVPIYACIRLKCKLR